MFANVSHELRTPLTLILGPIEKLLSTDLPEEATERLRLAQRNARGLLKQINDLLDVARLEAGKTTLTYYEVDLAKVIKHLASSFDSSAREKQIRFSVVTPPRMAVETDIEKFERILVNLLSNAFKFTPAGGAIRCQLHENTGTLAIIEVVDSGPGVPEAFRSSIFDQFFQIPGTTRFGGTGLGLSIVKEFCDLQRGRVTVGKSADGGALFRIELPVVAPEKTPVIHNPNTVLTAPAFVEAPAARSPARKSRQTRHQEPTQRVSGKALRKSLVLVVEDNPDMRDYICETLGTNVDLETAENGREGVEKARTMVPDLIISDIMMPEMGGEEMFREIRRIRELEAIPFILVTAKADDELRMELLREGAIDYLIKPFAQEELRSKVRNFLAVKASETKYRGLMESAQDSILVVGEDRTIRFANQQATAWFGYANEELVGASMEILFPERFRASYVAQQNAYLSPSDSRRMADRNIELAGRRKDGSEFPVSIALSALYTPEGLLITAIVRDISEMKKLSEANLARAARLTMMGAMAGSIVHEISQPLSAMTTNGNACLRWLSHHPPNLDEARLAVDDIVKDGRRASEIVRSIRSLASKSAPELSQLDVNDAIREVFVLMRSEIRRRNVRLESELSCLEPVLADRVQLQQVVLNLMMNGIDAMSAVVDQPRVLRVGSRLASPGSVLVAVEDSGLGLAPETIDHLFEAFFTTKAGGMGMGLSICRAIVEAHGGRLSASPRSPRGAIFEFTVPTAAERVC
jgi:PAS domain S-box-containing protein